jgi:hypothetical protein
MKYLKISIKGGTGGKMFYPEKYQEEIGNFAVEHLYYEDVGNYDLLLCINDLDFKSSMIREGVKELSEIEAIAISESNEIRTEFIKDETKHKRIELKVAQGIKLTKDETDSLDITKSSSIYGKKEIFADKILKHKSMENK